MAFTLITGASKGIGMGMAYECASRGMNILLVARDQAKLESVQADLLSKFKIEVKNFAIDLSLKESPKQLFDFCVKENIQVDKLINNAGFSLWGEFGKRELAEQLEMISLNISTLVALTHLFLPMLKQQKQAYILNVASVAGFLPLPYLAVYAATKSFVISFSRALKHELDSTGVKVSCLCPGNTDTDFWVRNGIRNAGEAKTDFGLMSPRKVAQKGIKGMLSGKDVIVPGMINKFYAASSKVFTKWGLDFYGLMNKPSK